MDQETKHELALWAVLIAVWTAIKACLYHRNKKENEEPNKAVQGIIYTQHAEEIKKLHYGVGSMDYCGCAVIALYNAMILLGKRADLSQVIQSFQRRNVMLYAGVFGSNVWLISRAIKDQGLFYERVRLSDLNRDGVYIIAFWNKGAPFHGSHAVCVVTSKGIKRTYNLGHSNAVSMVDPAEYAGRRYICGYRILRNNEVYR